MPISRATAAARRKSPATLFGAEGTDHVKLDRDLGLAGDPATRVLFEFTDGVLKPKP
ncbi:MAG: hypothetical protein HUU41_04580 [Bryobacteraceae bacterium]|nr:hypothetical protein [Bryobacterales bacterium]MEB2361178.1 hypothetical protein [Bryobacterales bacterium]NUN00366.1 hypothetical protein [Bryobacteraceae bacterium]